MSNSNGPATRVTAAVFDGPGQPLRLTDVDVAPPGPGEVTVAIAAAGVCHSDLHVVKGEWPVATPTILGHEGSGTITALSDGVTGLDVGDHVVLSWMANCGACRYCRAGRPAHCAQWNSTVGPHGVIFDGTSRLSVDGTPAHHYLGVSSFAELAVVPASGAIKVRRDAPLDLIAMMGCAVATGVGAVLNTAHVRERATVAVIGCGGVGLSVVQGARLAGASRIIAIDVVPDKLTLAAKLGATDTLDASRVDAVAALKELVPEGLDYVFDAIGKTQPTEQAVAALGLGGAAVIVGLPPAGSSARLDPLALATNDQRILGSNYGSIDPRVDIPKLVDWFMDGQIDVESMVSARMPLLEANRAMDNLANGRALRQLLVPADQ